MHFPYENHKVKVLDGVDSLNEDDSDNNNFGGFSQSMDKRKVTTVEKIAEEVEHKYMS